MLAVFRGGPFDGEQQEVSGRTTRLHKLMPTTPGYFGPEPVTVTVATVRTAVYDIGDALALGVREFHFVTMAG